MDRDDRLAALLAGELSAADADALRAALAVDPALADRLAAMQRADAALRALPPTAEPDGFAVRLTAALTPEVHRQVHVTPPELAAAAAASDTAPGAPGSAVPGAPPATCAVAPQRPQPTRAGRGWPRWLAPVGAAAGLLLVTGTATVVLLGPGAGNDADLALDAPAAELAPAEPGMAPQATDDEAAPAADAEGPVTAMDAPGDDLAARDHATEELADAPEADLLDDAAGAPDASVPEPEAPGDAAPGLLPAAPVVRPRDAPLDTAAIDALVAEVLPYTTVPIDPTVLTDLAVSWQAELARIEPCLAEVLPPDALPLILLQGTVDGGPGAGVALLQPGPDGQVLAEGLLLRGDDCTVVARRGG